jgi:phosphoribosylformylglycinamidine (FGAM) synthase-like enzyme
MHGAIAAGLVRACHDLSEGGLAVAAAEMSLAGRLGLRLELDGVPHGQAQSDAGETQHPSDMQQQLAEAQQLGDTQQPAQPLSAEADVATVLLFSESNTRFLCEVRPADAAAFEQILDGVALACIGQVTAPPLFEVYYRGKPLIRLEVDELIKAWQSPLDW